MSVMHPKGTDTASAVLRSFHDVVWSHQPSLLLTANTSVGEKCYRHQWTAVVRGAVCNIRLSLLTNLTVVVIPSGRDEWLKFERNDSFAGLERPWIRYVQVLENP